MASDLDFIGYACDQLGGAGRITFRKMLGEAAVYCEGKVVALIRATHAELPEPKPKKPKAAKPKR